MTRYLVSPDAPLPCRLDGYRGRVGVLVAESNQNGCGILMRTLKFDGLPPAAFTPSEVLEVSDGGKEVKEHETKSMAMS